MSDMAYMIEGCPGCGTHGLGHKAGCAWEASHVISAPKQVPAPVGWLCPRCGRGNSPTCVTCPCIPPPPMVVTC